MKENSKNEKDNETSTQYFLIYWIYSTSLSIFNVNFNFLFLNDVVDELIH